MAFPDTKLIGGLRLAANSLRKGEFYAWGHHGACNCGHLLQVTTSLSKENILAHAHTAPGEWTEIADEYCETSNSPASLLVAELMQLGLTNTDIHHLEYLDDRAILNQLPGGFRWLKKNQREDVILYFETFADQLDSMRIDAGLDGEKKSFRKPVGIQKEFTTSEWP